MNFEPIRQNSLADICEAKIRRAIIDEGLKPGDALPGEIELSERMGVSRNVVREALSRLRMLGILESRKRRGMVIREPELLDGLNRVLDLPVISEKTKRELLELNMVNEMGQANVIMDRVRQEHLDRLERIVMREEANPYDENLTIECDAEFHSVLYETVGNELLTQFQEMLRPFKKNFAINTGNRFDDPSIVDHRMLLEALKRHDRNEFNELMRRHLTAAYKSNAIDSWEVGDINRSGKY